MIGFDASASKFGIYIATIILSHNTGAALGKHVTISMSLRVTRLLTVIGVCISCISG
jgi:hypothetical protein